MPLVEQIAEAQGHERGCRCLASGAHQFSEIAAGERIFQGGVGAEQGQPVIVDGMVQRRLAGVERVFVVWVEGPGRNVDL